MKTVYIAGPISLGGACSEAEIAAFSEVFYAEEKRLRAHGYEVLNPCRTEPQNSWEDYMRHGLTSVCRADVVAVLPRWIESRGAMLEAFVARQLSIPVVPVETLPASRAQKREAMPSTPETD